MSAPAQHSQRPLPTGRPQLLVLVGWHQAQGGIVFFSLDGKPSSAWSVDFLQTDGSHPSGGAWLGGDADYRKALPRIDQSPLAVGR
jgi:hypothetical protein